jgi:predicted dehydrogenase
MRVSIIGAGRNRNGIGEFIGKYFQKNGARVVSVLGTSEDSSRRASHALRKYGIDAAPYTDFRRMVEKEKPDVAVIASPAATHREYLLKCVESGLSVFCEKPFTWGPMTDADESVEEIFRIGAQKRLTVAMNSQWPFAIRFYEEICGKIEVKEENRFFILLSPFLPGREMIPESVPHALSLLYFIFGKGELRDLEFEPSGEGRLEIRLRYVSGSKHCDSLIQLVSQREQPRDFQFGFNGKVVSRVLNPGDYEIYFQYGERRLKIADPLELSIRDFISAVEKKTEPLVGFAHVLSTASLLKKIFDRYQESESKKDEKNEEQRA